VIVVVKWLISILAVSIGFGAVSALVAVRRAYFLAAGLTHAALLAGALALILDQLIGGTAMLWTVLVMVFITAPLTLLLAGKIDPQQVSAVFVAATASASVIVLHHIAARGPAGEVLRLVTGDPLLVTDDDLVLATIIALSVLAVAVLTYKEQVCVSIDRDGARLAGIRVWLYDITFLFTLSATVAGLLRLAGFILSHVYLLLPGAVATMVARRASSLPWVSLATSILSGLIGLLLSLRLDVAPTGAIGLIMLSIYILAVLATRRR
jgi:ABC-type Mn2+/Zn2+ transport system permease subunit